VNDVNLIQNFVTLIRNCFTNFTLLIIAINKPNREKLLLMIVLLVVIAEFQGKSPSKKQTLRDLLQKIKNERIISLSKMSGFLLEF
jgi:hypothetical protein